ncbi:SPOR domain-containing protein [Colwelliaceae bacterium 6441]
MSTPFQNRLVGTIIVAAVAIIFLPDLLDGDKKTFQEEFDKIPSAPQIDFQPKGQSFPSDKVASVIKEEVVDELALDDSQNEVTKVIEKQVTEVEKAATQVTRKENPLKNEEIKKSTQLPKRAEAQSAWVIQLGSFRHKKNVDELVNKLKAEGYKAFTKPIKTKNGMLTKVFVGPELIKSSLEKKIPALKVLTNVQGKVARFTPTK